jgi:hypothetical protein
MDLGFLSNPANTGISAVTLLLLAGGVLRFLSKRRVSIGKDGVKIDNAMMIDGRFLDKIPAIDRERKNKLQKELYNRKDTWLGMMHEIPDKTIRLFLMMKLLEVLTTKIFSNHLTVIFGDKGKYAEWKDEVVMITMAKMRYVEDYTGVAMGEKAGGLDEKGYTSLLTSELEQCMAAVRTLMKSVITESCEAKLEFYREILQSGPNNEQAAKAKELIERNESYIKRIAEF